MAISVDPMTFVITVPKADLSLIQSSPEVRELNINTFRLWLKDWEDDQQYGCYMPKTNTHNTEVTLAGLTYARIVEILPPYTVEFEDGQYTVNCVGANHNISDRKVANQVSLIVNNAAGLIGNAQIEYGSFNGGVTLDESSSNVGTLFPTGTPSTPVNNWSDALLIASVRGFTTFYVMGDSTVDGSNNFDNMEIIGESPNKSTLTIGDLSSTVGLELKNATVTGTLDGSNFISDSTVSDLTYFNGEIIRCGLIGDIVLGGTGDVEMVDCRTVDQDNPPVIDMGGSGCSLVMPNYAGLLTIKNLNDSDQEIGIGFNAGAVVLDSTITAANEIIISGVGSYVNNSSVTPNVSSLLSNTSIASAVWTSTEGAAVISDIETIRSMESGRWHIVGNQMIFYEEDNSTEVMRFNLFNSSGNPTMTDVYQRVKV